MAYTVDIIPKAQQYEPDADEALYWNVHSTYNDGYKPTDTLWEWFREHRVDVEDWDTEDILGPKPQHDYLDLDGDIIGLRFTFANPDHATLFKLTWA